MERMLLDNALDALDDLYDRRERAEWWTERLLAATGVALADTQWRRRRWRQQITEERIH